MNLNLKQLINAKNASRLTKSLPFLSVILAIISVYSVIYLVHALHIDDLANALELRTYDWRNSIALFRDKHKPSKDIVIISFDDPTYARFQNDYGNWPWPRSIHADLIHYLNNAGARGILFDLMFLSRDKGNEASDQQLIQAFKENKNVFISMNFDHNRIIEAKAGRNLGEKLLTNVEKLSLPVKTTLTPTSTPYKSIDETGYYFNSITTFNNVRPILPELLDTGERIGLINHMRDSDGVSRRNPLLYRLVYESPLISQLKPYHYETKTKRWLDKENRHITPKGQLIDSKGNQQKHIKVKYFPYIALLAHNTLVKGYTPKTSFTVTEPGILNFGSHHIPLTNDGSMLIHWYHHNVDQAEYETQLHSLETQNQASPSPVIQQQIEQTKARLTQPFSNKPYVQIPAWQIIESIHRVKAGKQTQQDTQLINFLKQKIIFIGTTSVSTYDIKTTPLEKVFPGVVMQAIIFDNLYQNNHYARQIPKTDMSLITSLLCLCSALVMNRMRSAILGFVAALSLGLLYGLFSLIAFQYYGLWFEVVMPVAAMFGISILVFMFKYVNKSQAYESTYQMATTDSMTGLRNYRFFKDTLDELIHTANETGEGFSLLLADIDFFKKFNDTYGHQAGDAVLRQVAHQLKASVRDSDIVARYGGEEMAILLPKAAEKDALLIAQKVVTNVGKEPFTLDAETQATVTVSVGVAAYPLHGQSPDELIEFADKGLYRAKDNGRNQVGAMYDKHKSA